MRSKKIVIVYAIILFAIIFVIAFNSICAITQMDVRFNVSSDYAKQKTIKIQNDMNEYLKKNYLFFKTDTVEKYFENEENVHFKLLSVAKKFPNKIIIEVEEMFEYFAFYNQSENNYYVSDKFCEVITIKDSVKNNLSGNNIEIKGFNLNLVEVNEKIGVIQEQIQYFNGVMSALNYFDTAFDGVRTNIVSVSFDETTYSVVFQTQEGVQFYFPNISKYSEQLFELVANTYQNEITDDKKTSGRIAAYVKDDNSPDVQYVSNSVPI